MPFRPHDVSDTATVQPPAELARRVEVRVRPEDRPGRNGTVHRLNVPHRADDVIPGDRESDRQDRDSQDPLREVDQRVRHDSN